MARRHARYGAERRPRRFAVFSLAALALLGAVVWVAPTVAVLTSLRDRPLEMALAGIDGSVSSARARWAWLGPVSFHDVVLRDRSGRAAAIVPEVVIDRGLLQLALAPRDLGTVRFVGPEVVVEVRPDGSSLEDILAPWLAAPKATAPAGTLEVVDGVVELVDLPRGNTWRVGELFAAVAIETEGGVGGWTVGGRVRHVGHAPAGGATVAPSATAAQARRVDRSTVAAGAAAALARDGGFSCSHAALGGDAERTVTVAAHRLPLGVSSVAATRFGGSHVADGLAEIRLDVEFAAGHPRVEGTVEAQRLAICRADTLAELVSIDAIEVPVDLAVADGCVTVTKLEANSKLFHAEASGRLPLPTGGPWEWLDGLAAENFAVAADVDLAAVAKAIVGGLVVREDVGVTDGHLEIAAAARPDGDGRVLEMRVSARDLAAEQTLVDEATGKRSSRPLRWTEPFAAWLKARRGPAGGLRVDEARLTSAAMEVTATGGAEGATVQWTLDIGQLVAEAAEVVNLAGATLAGRSRGRVEITSPTATGPSRVTLAADLEDFALTVPGRPAWRDEALSITAEGTGRIVAGAALVEAAHAIVSGGDDRLEGTLAGGAVIDLAGLSRGMAAVRPTAAGTPAAADVTLSGDLGRWHARLAPLLPPAFVDGVELAGRIKAVVATVARGDAWEITRAGAEVDRIEVATADGARIAEPRLVASAAGLVWPTTGRIDLASAEVLTATVSLRTAGLAWRPVTAGGGWRDRLRGQVQWQADVGRLERWLVAPPTSDRWSASGRAWGTVELVDGADGLDIVVAATGSQLAVAELDPARPAAPPRPVWAEPQATLAVDCALVAAAPDTVRVDRVKLESSTLALEARGAVDGRPRAFALDGTLVYDWQQVSRLMAPWTKGLVQLAGAGGRPFALRGRLGETPVPAPPLGATATGDSLPLPDDWVTASQAGAAAARVAVPVATTPSRSVAVDLVRALALDTSIAWQAGDLAGFQLAPGEIPVRLLEGQLAFGPFDVGVSGGRLRGAPWLSLAAQPREIVVPPGRLVERVAIGGEPARRMASWLSPLLGHATHTSGFVSVDLAGARVPLADPFAGLADGQVVFEALEVAPSAAMAPLAMLLAKLQAVIDPRLALDDKPVLMRVRPDPVHVRLVERRLWHEGLVLDAGQLMVKSAGSVGADGTLAMLVEVSLRGDVAGQTPVVAQLLRTPLAIPLKGTVDKPQFDARAIDMLLARIVENTAQAVIGDGIARGLDALLGGQQAAPPPAAPPAPLVLPQGR